MEEYRDIQGYEGLYQVSNYGNVRSLYGKSRILKPSKDSGGYLSVGLSKNNSVKRHLVHRLVCAAFLDNPNEKPEVNHKDGIKTNNNVLNLEYVTPSENTNHAYANGLREKTIKSSVETHRKEVKCITTNTIYESAHEAWRQTGVHYNNISACCRGERKSAGKLNGKKLTWEYI